MANHAKHFDGALPRAEYTIFASVGAPTFHALADIARRTGLTKRLVIEATIAGLSGAPHDHKNAVTRAWREYRKETDAK